MSKTEPSKEQQWLAKMVGEWSMDGQAEMEPGKPPESFQGTERVRTMGDHWIIAEGEGIGPEGGTAGSLMILGYDPKKERFVGSFSSSMMPHLWIYEGMLDEEKNALTLDTEGPGISADGALARYKDTIEFRSDDHRVMTSNVQTADGTWMQIMTMNLRRK